MKKINRITKFTAKLKTKNYEGKIINSMRTYTFHNDIL